jgi:hypothetical protein
VDAKLSEGDKQEQNIKEDGKKTDGNEKKKNIDTVKEEDPGVSSKAVRTIKETGDVENLLKSSKQNGNGEEISNTRKTKNETSKSSPRSNKSEESTKLSTLDFVDEIFKSRRNSRRLLEKEFESVANDMTAEEQPKRKSDTEENLKESKPHKSYESTPKVAPRKDKKDVKTPGRSKS